MAFAQSAHAFSADHEIYQQFSSQEVATKVLEFLRARPVPQKQKETILENSRPEDRVELKRLLSTWKPDLFSVQLETDTIVVSNRRGQVQIEISRNANDGQTVINGRTFQRPLTGSIFAALKVHLSKGPLAKHLPRVLSPIDLILPPVIAADVEPASALPAYLYIEFASAGETPTKSYSAEDEATKSAQQIQSAVMPDGSNALTAYAKRYFSETKSSVTCSVSGSGTTATGIVQLAGELHRFESRPNGDIVIRPPFENGSAVLLKPSRVDLGQASQQISELAEQHRKSPSVQSALQIVDGPVRLICQRLQLLKPNPRAASMCEKLFQQKISIEGRCNRLDGVMKAECLSAASELLPGRLINIFEQDLLKFVASELAELVAIGKSVESSQIIGRKMYFHQCLDGSACEKTYFPTVLEVVQPSTGEVSKNIRDLLSERHPATGTAGLVKYLCEVQNETCAVLTTTEAALMLPKRDFEKLRAKISQANRGRVFKKSAFLEQASALRPLGQCCASTTCKTRLQKLTGGTVKFSESERIAK